MYAIVETGGKQFRVEEGRTINIQKIQAEAGSELVLDKVLLVDKSGDVTVGQPFVGNAKISCEVVGHGRDKKIIVFHKRRRKGFMKKQGHRQDFTTIKIKAIEA
ncbi:large subunit ribosomal protein L21 [Desulfobaculum xiamenense]|uniref:Large ribosomal subunit protein bL21 n=1 Tax=Desulfobaculum xiamenense TaxID=995050 RepID=A0A846QLC7_9BACT|nr:50S ribosomal protein L21 [Desulfobaculum xiamenense]NJB68921.1 large subunit ribosomal protein L21 [Desulfobaculum xiamenense]